MSGTAIAIASVATTQAVIAQQEADEAKQIAMCAPKLSDYASRGFVLTDAHQVTELRDCLDVTFKKGSDITQGDAIFIVVTALIGAVILSFILRNDDLIGPAAGAVIGAVGGPIAAAILVMIFRLINLAIWG